MPGCRVPTADTSKNTVEHRSEVLSTLRQIFSGGDNSTQLAVKIKSLSKEEREDLLQQAQLTVTILADHALAIKADLSIPWTKLRLLRR